MSKTFYPPEDFNLENDWPTIFLAGSIEQGVAEDWQQLALHMLNKNLFNILNPRQKNWDATRINDPEYLGDQVRWELQGIDIADAVIMYFDPATKSPISLLELGILLSDGMHTTNK